VPDNVDSDVGEKLYDETETVGSQVRLRLALRRVDTDLRDLNDAFTRALTILKDIPSIRSALGGSPAGTALQRYSPRQRLILVLSFGSGFRQGATDTAISLRNMGTAIAGCVSNVSCVLQKPGQAASAIGTAYGVLAEHWDNFSEYPAYMNTAIQRGAQGVRSFDSTQRQSNPYASQQSVRNTTYTTGYSIGYALTFVVAEGATAGTVNYARGAPVIGGAVRSIQGARTALYGATAGRALSGGARIVRRVDLDVGGGTVARSLADASIPEQRRLSRLLTRDSSADPDVNPGRIRRWLDNSDSRFTRGVDYLQRTGRAGRALLSTSNDAVKRWLVEELYERPRLQLRLSRAWYENDDVSLEDLSDLRYRYNRLSGAERSAFQRQLDYGGADTVRMATTFDSSDALGDYLRLGSVDSQYGSPSTTRTGLRFRATVASAPRLSRPGLRVTRADTREVVADVDALPDSAEREAVETIGETGEEGMAFAADADRAQLGDFFGACDVSAAPPGTPSVAGPSAGISPSVTEPALSTLTPSGCDLYDGVPEGTENAFRDSIIWRGVTGSCMSLNRNSSVAIVDPTGSRQAGLTPNGTTVITPDLKIHAR
jgi:hypothetical protein